MSNTLLIICYIIALYGAATVMVFGSGPFRILEHIRHIANKIHPHFGLMFSCMMCFPTQLGLLCGAFSWWFSPVQFTPFSILFYGNPSLWWLMLLLDGSFAAGCVWFIHNVLDTIMKKGDSYGVVYETAEEDAIIAEDITNGRH